MKRRLDDKRLAIEDSFIIGDSIGVDAARIARSLSWKKSRQAATASAWWESQSVKVWCSLSMRSHSRTAGILKIISKRRRHGWYRKIFTLRLSHQAPKMLQNLSDSRTARFIWQTGICKCCPHGSSHQAVATCNNDFFPSGAVKLIDSSASLRFAQHGFIWNVHMSWIRNI